MDKTFLDQIKLPTIRHLRRFVYKKIFEKLSYQEEVILDRALKFYSIVGRLSVRELNDLISLNQLLVKNENGDFGEMKDKIKERKLNYKLIYGVR